MNNKKTLFQQKCTSVKCVYNVSNVCKKRDITDVCKSYNGGKNTHKINTVQDMISCTNESNLDNFLADLKLVIMSAHLIGKGESKGFTWINDEKNNVETTLMTEQSYSIQIVSNGKSLNTFINGEKNIETILTPKKP